MVQTATPPQASPTVPIGSPTVVAQESATSTVAAPSRRTGPSADAVFTDAPPVIDGDLSEWSVTPILVTSVVYGASAHSGSSDLSANVMLLWDQTNLYIGATVIDDVYAQNASGIYLFRGDSVEVLLDTRVGADYYTTNLSSDDFQLGLSPGSPTIGRSPESFLWFPRNIEGSRSQVKIGARSTVDGYQIEAAIPWTVFGVTPASGQHYGFGFSVSDNDNTGQDLQQSMVSNLPNRRLADPTTWGDLTLTLP